MKRIELLKRKLEREIQSRKESEKLLEEKSHELLANSEKLRVINRDLEQIIEQRTHDLEESRDNAVRANLAKSQFLANMSHEIRTPIHGILGMVEVLSNETKDNTQKEYLDNILNAGELLLSIINDILDLSRIESGKIEIEENEFSPKELINTLCIPFGPQATKKGISFECVLDENLNNKVIGDDNRLRQVLINLVGNAIKFTSVGGVSVNASVLENTVTVSVQDTGPGIASDRIATIFEAFKQADASDTRKFGGSGLGLTISKALVEKMGGTLSVRSELGKGSTFAVSIPFKPVEHFNGNQDHVGNANQSIEVKLKEIFEHMVNAPKVLLAEDNLLNQKIAQLLLLRFNFSVDIAEDGVKACELSSKINYSAILMDCQMPRMDGFEATRKIRTYDNYKNVPIIALTANAFSSTQKKCISAGMNDFLTKPFSPEQLLFVLHKNLIRKKAA